MIRSESLKKNQDFKVVYQNGTSYANRLLVMYVLKNQHMNNRLVISVSKKVGNSVVRHRLTRLIRESYRLNETDFDSNLDFVVVKMLKAARKAEKIIDGMFKKTSLGRMVGLKPEEKTKKEKQKENNMHGH